MKINQLLAVVFAVVLFAACGSESGNSYITEPSGMKYKIHHDEAGENIKMGDFVKFEMISSVGNDSVLTSSYDGGKPFEIKMTESRFKGDIFDGMAMLSLGDSADIMVRLDSIYKGNVPAEMPGEFIKYTVKITEVMDEAAFNAMKAEENKAVIDAQNAQLEAYMATIADKEILQDESGLQYIVEAMGTGKQAEAGKKVKVHYTGKLLDGTKFDSSKDRDQPFEFVLGTGSVIKGWDIGIAKFKEGGKGTLIIPYNLAYGDRGTGPIPPFATLTFDIELLEVMD